MCPFAYYRPESLKDQTEGCLNIHRCEGLALAVVMYKVILHLLIITTNLHNRRLTPVALTVKYAAFQHSESTLEASTV